MNLLMFMLFQKFDNAEKTAEYIGADYDTFSKTLEDYNKFVEKYKSGEKAKDSFGKTVFPVEFPLDKTFYVATITPAIHYVRQLLSFNNVNFGLWVD